MTIQARLLTSLARPLSRPFLVVSLGQRERERSESSSKKERKKKEKRKKRGGRKKEDQGARLDFKCTSFAFLVF